MTDNIIDFYNQLIRPKLTIALVYSNVRFTICKGKYWRGCCPIHKGDNPTAFSVNVDTLAWRCFTRCGKGSVLAFINGGIEPKGKTFVDTVYLLASLVNVNGPKNNLFSYKNLPSVNKTLNIQKTTITQPHNYTVIQNSNDTIKQIHNDTTTQPLNKLTSVVNKYINKNEITNKLKQFQDALPGSLGEKYLLHRKISLSLAQQYGVGYAAFGTWPHKARDWKWGRLVFPHSSPDGQIINLYGRAIGSLDAVPKNLRHDHLAGAKGYFNGQIIPNADHLFVCEGSFDAISLIAAGFPNSIAIFGVHGWRWDWSYNIKKLIFALDNDLGGAQWKTLARQACLRGKQVYFLPSECYGGKKDINEAWVGDCLFLDLSFLSSK